MRLRERSRARADDADGCPRRHARRTSRDSTPSSISPRCRTTRSAISTSSWTYDINLDATLAVARAAKEAGVRQIRLRVLVLDVRRLGRRRPARRERTAPPADGLRRVEGAGGGGPRRARRSRLRGRVDAERDGLRRVAATAPRHRAQQPGRVGAHDGPHPPPLRRAVVAAADPRPRPLARRARHARGARRPRPRRGIQRRLRRAELPDPRPRGRARRGHRMRDRARIRRVARPALVPGRLLAARARVPDASLRVGLPSRVRGAGRRVPRAAADHGAVRGSAIRPSPTASPPPRQRRARGGTPVDARRRRRERA